MDFCIRCHHPVRIVQPHHLGPRCYTRVVPALVSLERSPNSSARRAARLVREGHLVPSEGGAGEFLVRSLGPAGDWYATSVSLCTCPAGSSGNLCYHRVAVTVLLLA